MLKERKCNTQKQGRPEHASRITSNHKQHQTRVNHQKQTNVETHKQSKSDANNHTLIEAGSLLRKRNAVQPDKHTLLHNTTTYYTILNEHQSDNQRHSQQASSDANNHTYGDADSLLWKQNAVRGPDKHTLLNTTQPQSSRYFTNTKATIKDTHNKG